MKRHAAVTAKQARNEDQRQQKLQAILEAAFDVFSAKGFAETRLEDVARRAGVAKGTIYLYVSSKQDLFEAMIRNSFTASFDTLETSMANRELTVEQMVTVAFDWFEKEILGTRRREILWMILREAKQFPELARAHHQLLVSRALGIVRACCERWLATGEIRFDEVQRFPQLAVAPGLVAIIWMELFGDIEPLDTAGLMRAHKEMILRALKGSSS